MGLQPPTLEPASRAELARQRLVEGPLLPAILRLALPAVGSFYLQAAYNFIDRYWVGRLPDGAAAFAGLSAAMFILWSTFSLTHLISIGTGAMISRAIGGQDIEQARRIAGQGILLAIGVSIITAACLLPSLPGLFDLMGTSEVVTRNGMAYITVLLSGLPLMFLSFILNSIYYASGDTVTPTKFVAATLVVNAVLDPILMYGWLGMPAMGIAGTAYATLISQGIWVVGGLILLARGRANVHLTFRHVGRINLKIWGGALRIGLPQCISGLLFAAVYMALTNLTSEVGTGAVAGLGIGHTAEQITFFAGLGFNVAAATMVGQNLGAGKPDRAGRAAWTAAGIATVYNAMIGLCFILFPSVIVRIFVEDPATVSMGSSYLMILSLSQPFMALEIVLAGGFSGAGNTVPPMAIQVPLTIARYPVALLLMRLMGSDGIWWAISLSTVAKAICIAIWFKTGRWKRKRL